jgi:hypothetical protein
MRKGRILLRVIRLCRNGLSRRWLAEQFIGQLFDKIQCHKLLISIEKQNADT